MANVRYCLRYRVGQHDDIQRTFQLSRLNEVTPSPPTVSLEVFPRTHHAVPVTRGLDGDFVRWKEVIAPAPAQPPAASASLQRQPGVQSGVAGLSSNPAGSGTRSGNLGITFVRGRGSYMPFRPGGLDDGPQRPSPAQESQDDFEEDAGTVSDIEQVQSTWRTTPPGFQRGLDLASARSGEADEASSNADELLLRVFGSTTLKPSAQRQLRSQQEQGVSITRKTGLARETALLDSVSRIVTVRWPFHVLTCV